MRKIANRRAAGALADLDLHSAGRNAVEDFSAAVRCSPTYWANDSVVVLAIGNRRQSSCGKHPAAIGEVASTSPAVGRHADRRVLRGQEHPMIQLGDDAFQGVSDHQEIDHALAIVQRAEHLGGHAVGVPVQPLAHAAFQRDEVGGAENQIIVGDANVEIGHVQSQFVGWFTSSESEGFVLRTVHPGPTNQQSPVKTNLPRN